MPTSVWTNYRQRRGCEMSSRTMVNRLKKVLVALLLMIASVSVAIADQISLAFIDSRAEEQVLTVDTNSDLVQLARVAALLSENGVEVSYDPASGAGSLVEIAKAMATAAPMFGADIAMTFAALAPDQKQAIVEAVNSVTDVNTEAVLAAVHFGTPIRVVVPPTDKDVDVLPIIEQIPSKN